jgi:hypothetical protein
VSTLGAGELPPQPVVTAEPLVPDAPAVAAEAAPAAVDPGAAADATATTDLPIMAHHSRRLHLVAGLRWLLARALAILVFVLGVTLGYGAFLATQAPPLALVDPATGGNATPAVVEEFITALASNDAAALRSAVPTAPYQLLIAEMDRWEYRSISSVERLSTYADGPRTATELVLHGTTTAGNPVTVNLVVHVDAGTIVSFR